MNKDTPHNIKILNSLNSVRIQMIFVVLASFLLAEAFDIHVHVAHLLLRNVMY